MGTRVCPRDAGWTFGPRGATRAARATSATSSSRWGAGLTCTHVDPGVQAVLYHTIAGINRFLAVPRVVAAILHAVREALAPRSSLEGYADDEALGAAAAADPRHHRRCAPPLGRVASARAAAAGGGAFGSLQSDGGGGDDDGDELASEAALRRRARFTARCCGARPRSRGGARRWLHAVRRVRRARRCSSCRAGHAVLSGPRKVVLAGEWHLAPDGVRAAFARGLDDEDDAAADAHAAPGAAPARAGRRVGAASVAPAAPAAAAPVRRSPSAAAAAAAAVAAPPPPAERASCAVVGQRVLARWRGATNTPGACARVRFDATARRMSTCCTRRRPRGRHQAQSRTPRACSPAASKPSTPSAKRPAQHAAAPPATALRRTGRRPEPRAQRRRAVEAPANDPPREGHARVTRSFACVTDAAPVETKPPVRATQFALFMKRRLPELRRALPDTSYAVLQRCLSEEWRFGLPPCGSIFGPPGMPCQPSELRPGIGVVVHFDSDNSAEEGWYRGSVVNPSDHREGWWRVQFRSGKAFDVHTSAMLYDLSTHEKWPPARPKAAPSGKSRP